MCTTSDKPNKNQDVSAPIAWTLSIGVHIGVGLLAFFITWSVIREDDTPPQVVTASWHEQPIVEEALQPLQLPQEPEVKKEKKEVVIPKRKVKVEIKKPLDDGLAVLHQIETTGEVPKEVLREPETEVQFMGLDAVAAKRIVYVVDASGSMMLHLSSVLKELERSLRALHPKQEFAIIFFQKRKAIQVPPKGDLVFANANNVAKAIRWIHKSGKVIPTGGSNPIVAMKDAMRLKPEVIYLLSENITGAGQYEVPPKELLLEIDALNPKDSRNGMRQVQINCVQYLSQDVRGTMKKIAEIHGGEDGYTFIERGTVVK
jgi:hypothetical protein